MCKKCNEYLQKPIDKQHNPTFLNLGMDSFIFFYFYLFTIDMQAEQVPLKESVIKCLSPKEIKALVRPEFQKNPEKYYPTQTFLKMGFSRSQCEKCGHFFWRKNPAVTICGDSNCKGQYTFIGKGCGIGLQGQKITYKDAWDGFQRSLTTARIPCKPVARYPVIARWRNDVQYVAAGIYCFQPYCVTGELDPPENPAIEPIFCVRFNDLDNIGLTGRHYSGFVMLGIHVFNKPENFIFFKEECVEFNYRWLTEELKIDPEEITFVEDIWAGGGNMGPSVEYFIHGLELGNMVFMQYKYDNEGNYEELPVKVIDVGIGLERIPWLINGSATSYTEVFHHAFPFLNEALQIKMDNQIWRKLGPYTSRLDIDESENIEKTWEDISKLVDLPVESVKKAIEPIKELFVILDHTRTAFIIIQDGGLPSNAGGGSNLRNIIRRVFAIMKKNGWWEKIGNLEGFLRLFEEHKRDLEKIFGPFGEYKSFGDIIRIEYERWSSTEAGHKKKLEQLLSKTKGKLTLDQWIMAMESWGIPADAIAEICKCSPPDNLYNEIAARAEKITKAAEPILYDTINFPQTENLYYINHRLYEFEGKVIAVLKNAQEKEKGNNIILLDRSAFYPNSGGQANDLGQMTIGGVTYHVYNVQKVGKCFLHYLDREVDPTLVVGQTVVGKIDKERRDTLICFHTGTHIVYAAARRILGPHVWQHGAKKTENYAHIDITHYESITKEKEMEIENEANKIILEGHKITKYFENKKTAEEKHGFNLYQGGIVPGNTIRVVNIDGVDVEACCGTHADNTSEVGWVKIFKATRISDGVLRLYYMAGKKVMKQINEQTTIINKLKDLWGIRSDEIVGTANRFFNDYKKFEKETQSQKMSLLGIQVKYISESKNDKYLIGSLEKEMTLYFSNMNTTLVPLIENDKSVVFLNDSIFFAVIASPEHCDIPALKAILVEDLKQKLKEDLVKKGSKEEPKEGEAEEIVQKKLLVKKGLQFAKGKEKKKKENAFQVSFSGRFKEKRIQEFFLNNKFDLLK